MHRQPVASCLGAPGPGPLPGTDEAARTHLALPMGAALPRAQIAEVVAAVRAAKAT